MRWPSASARDEEPQERPDRLGQPRDHPMEKNVGMDWGRDEVWWLRQYRPHY